MDVGTLPEPVNIIVYAGDDFWLDLTVTTDTGTAMDLTGCTAMAQIRTTTASYEVLADLAATIAGNVITLHLQGADSATLPPKAVWDVQLTDVNDDVTTLASGSVRVTAEVTRPFVVAEAAVP